MEGKVSKSEWDANVTPPITTSPQCIVSTYFDQVAWEEETDTVWRTTEAGVEEEDKEV